MLDKLAQIAPLSTWGYTLGAAALLLFGFVAFGHAKVVHQAYYKRFHGPLAPGIYETMLRWTVVFLAAGVLSWGMALGWPTGLRVGLAAMAAAALVAELIARVRGAGSDAQEER